MKTKFNTYSEAYKGLFKRVVEIKQNLLDFPGDFLSCQTVKKQDCIKAFKILVHAEMEYYFEQQSQKVLSLAKDRFEQNKHLSNVLLTMLVYSNLPYAANQKDDEIDARIKRIFEDTNFSYSKNHGIKSDNLAQMFHQIGLPIRKKYSILCAELESYGTVRGELAHQSAYAITRRFYKNYEVEQISRVLNEISLLDNDIEQLYTSFVEHASISCVW